MLKKLYLVLLLVISPFALLAIALSVFSVILLVVGLIRNSIPADPGDTGLIFAFLFLLFFSVFVAKRLLRSFF